jgi:hypothetical protein
VEDVQFSPHVGLSDHKAETACEPVGPPYPTAGDVLAKIGGVIAICLGLALVANLLITPPPGV